MVGGGGPGSAFGIYFDPGKQFFKSLNSVSLLNRSRFKYCLCVNVHNTGMASVRMFGIGFRETRRPTLLSGGWYIAAVTNLLLNELIAAADYARWRFGSAFVVRIFRLYARDTFVGAHSTKYIIPLQRYNIIYGQRSYNSSPIAQMHAILYVLCSRYIVHKI